MHSVTPEIDLLRHGKKVKQRIMTSKFFLSTTFFCCLYHYYSKVICQNHKEALGIQDADFPATKLMIIKQILEQSRSRDGCKKRAPKKAFQLAPPFAAREAKKESENMNYYVTCNEAKRTSRITILLCSLRKGFLALLPSLITFSVRQ